MWFCRAIISAVDGETTFIEKLRLLPPPPLSLNSSIAHFPLLLGTAIMQQNLLFGIKFLSLSGSFGSFLIFIDDDDEFYYKIIKAIRVF